MSAVAQVASFPAGGGTAEVVVSTNRECRWVASASAGWIQLLDGASGQGEGRLRFSVAPNGDPLARQGTIRVEDQQVAVAQEAAPCRFEIDPAHASIPPAGGDGTIRVTASSAACSWTARSEASWLTILAGAEGTGGGQVHYQALATTGPPRSGALVVAGHTVPIAQGDGCTTTVDRASHSVSPAGGSGEVQVSAGEDCQWRATTVVPWIAIVAGSNGSGPGQVRFTVAPNISPERRATLTIGSRSVDVVQANGCNPAITPGGQVFAATGGNGTVGVTAGEGCPWSATASDPWVRITLGAGGSGPGSVTFSVAPHDGPARQASLTIGGRSFAIQQESGCAVAFSAPGIAFSPDGGGGTVGVHVGTGCNWTASSSDPWIQISAGHAGIGPGPINFVVGPNPGPERSGTIAAGGQTFSVRQSGGSE